MKKITSICLFLLMVSAMFFNTAYAAVSYPGDLNDDLAVLLIDADSGKTLYEQRPDEKIKPASTTKILTCLVAIENGDLSEKVTVSAQAAGTTGSVLEIKNGEEIVLEDLLVGMMMLSGNDAAFAVAEHIGGTFEDFVNMMNTLAEKIGMASSNFENPHGKDEDDHFVTARDMTKLGQYASKNLAFMKIIGHETYIMPETNKQRERTIENFDYLIVKSSEFYYQYATGMKTGSTTGAGGCLVASASKEGQNLICVVFGDNSNGKTERWTAAKSLFDYGFDNYTTLDVLELIDFSEPITAQVENYAAEDIYDGILEFYQPMPEQRYITLDKETALAIKDDSDTIEINKTFLEEPLTAPIYENDPVGTVTYKSFNTGIVIMTGNLVASRDVLDGGSSGSLGDSAVLTMPPKAIEDMENKKAWDKKVLLILLIIPVGLVIFIIIRLMTFKHKKRRKYKRMPTYSYKIKK